MVQAYSTRWAKVDAVDCNAHRCIVRRSARLRLAILVEHGERDRGGQSELRERDRGGPGEQRLGDQRREPDGWQGRDRLPSGASATAAVLHSE
jgi:hypothetical protein